MISLRTRLLTATAVGVSALLLVSGVGLYAALSRVLWAEFDESLSARAAALAALVEQDEDGVSFELAESPPTAATEAVADCYQLWLADGSLLARSASLGSHDLPRPADVSATTAYHDLSLPGRGPLRAVAYTFVPRLEVVVGPPQIVTLVAAHQTSGLLATLARVRDALLLVGSLAVVLALAVGAWAVQRGLRPVGELSSQLAALRPDNLSARLSTPHAPEELRPMVERLNDVLARVEAAFGRERRFTGDVAHELRTPLAGLRARVELALTRQRSAEDYRAALDGALQIGLQMQRTVETLLHLARADAGQLELRREPLDLCQLVRACWVPLDARARARQMHVEWRLSGPAQVQSDSEKLRLVVQNVLDNAVSHANEGGSIIVAVTRDNGHADLTIVNTGNAIPPERIERVFERFWRGDASFDGHPSRCGLGLPLCKAIIERLGGAISASASNGEFRVSVRCPAAESQPTA